MPVQYSGIVDEHNTVRKGVGVFDVSHMGEIDITGPEALRLTDYVTASAAGRLKTGRSTIRACPTSTADSSTTCWSTKSPTTTTSSASTPRTRKKTTRISERLLLAGLDYSLERFVVYVAAKPCGAEEDSRGARIGRV